jgi:methylthioribose-1-phosphate isomerase
MPRVKAVEWVRDAGAARAADGCLRVLDQTRLPAEVVYRDLRTVYEVIEAIRSLRVRGAPAIGVAGAYGVVLHAAHSGLDGLPEAAERIAASRPTAVNLAWAVGRLRRAWRAWAEEDQAEDLADRLLTEARAIQAEDEAMCAAIGRHGAGLIADGDGVLTHCNTGALATAGIGTALGVLLTAHEQGKRLHVYADETRPLLQGARLTAWELAQAGVPCTLICDGMAAQVMKEGRVRLVIVGADRIAANGDTANKIGTYGVAVLARHHGVPFYVAAPSSTFDLTLADGSGVPIEQRDAREVTHGLGRQTAPEGVGVYNPAFDVTPAGLISGVVTERGVVRPVTAEAIRRVLGSGGGGS